MRSIVECPGVNTFCCEEAVSAVSIEAVASCTPAERERTLNTFPTQRGGEASIVVPLRCGIFAFVQGKYYSHVSVAWVLPRSAKH